MIKEKQVIQDVHNTNESARSIARRQSTEKKQRKSNNTNDDDEDDDGGGVDMEEEEVDEEEEETKGRSGKLKVDRTDHADAWEVAYQDWFNTTIVPLQLTLEKLLRIYRQQK